MGEQNRCEWDVDQNLHKNGARDQDEARRQACGQAVPQRYDKSAGENRNRRKQHADGGDALRGKQRSIEIPTDPESIVDHDRNQILIGRKMVLELRRQPL